MNIITLHIHHDREFYESINHVACSWSYLTGCFRVLLHQFLVKFQIDFKDRHTDCYGCCFFFVLDQEILLQFEIPTLPRFVVTWSNCWSVYFRFTVLCGWFSLIGVFGVGFANTCFLNRVRKIRISRICASRNVEIIMKAVLLKWINDFVF